MNKYLIDYVVIVSKRFAGTGVVMQNISWFHANANAAQPLVNHDLFLPNEKVGVDDNFRQEPDVPLLVTERLPGEVWIVLLFVMNSSFGYDLFLLLRTTMICLTGSTQRWMALSASRSSQRG